MANPDQSSGISTRTLIIGGLAVAAAGAVGYALWFDNQRRRNPAFRKKLTAEKRKAAKAKAAAAESKEKDRAASRESARAVVAADDEPLPATPEEREAYFMENLQKGEMLFRQGPEFYETSALSFYRAMKVYPNPMDLLVLFQRTVPEPVFNALMEMMAADIKKKQEEYFDKYPRAEMKVKIRQTMDDGMLKRGLVALEDFEAGQKVYSEVPLVAAIDPALETGAFCSYCAKKIEEGAGVVDAEFDKWVYCCEVCKNKATEEYNQFFTSQKSALAALHAHILSKNAKYPLMVARFLGKMVAEEQRRSAELEAGTLNEDEVSIWEHVDKLQYIDIKENDADKEEAKIVTELVGAVQPGFEEFFTEERYRMLKGKLMYNAIAVQTVEPPFAPESPESSRRAQSTPTPVGAGLFHISSYLAHSCAPNARISFTDSNEATLTTLSPIKKGEEITVAYAPIDGMETEERRKVLASGWRFKCECSKCGSLDAVDE